MSDLSNKTLMLLILVSIVISLAGIFYSPKGVIYLTGKATSGESSTSFNITEEVSVLVRDAVNFYSGRVNAGSTNAILDSNLGKYNVSYIIKPISNPSKRITPIVFDSKRDVVVLFGGSSEEGIVNDTWEYDGSSWTDVTSSVGSSPAKRQEHAMAFDSSRNVTVLFGGMTEILGTHFNDTWEYDGSSWEQISTTHTPPFRIRTAMAYDSNRKVVVMYGGLGEGFEILNDTWEYNGTDWKEVSTSTNPGPLYWQKAVFDSSRNVIVMFGGYNGSDVLNKTWEYDGTNWYLRNVGTAPPARVSPNMAYDSKRNLTILFSGSLDGSDKYINDVWEYDGYKWMNVSWDIRNNLDDLEGFKGGMAYDDNRDVSVIFIGEAGEPYNDLVNVTLEYSAKESGGVVGGSWVFHKQFFNIENDGTCNITINFSADKNAASFIGGTSPSFKIKGVEDEEGACPDLVTTYTEVTTSQQNICPLLTYWYDADNFLVPVRVVVPNDAPPGEKSATITFTAAKAE
ncbi:MAG: kelch repeat-containing protein [Candidatus Woesearchaeota archaeon]